MLLPLLQLPFKPFSIFVIFLATILIVIVAIGRLLSSGIAREQSCVRINFVDLVFRADEIYSTKIPPPHSVQSSCSASFSSSVNPRFVKGSSYSSW